MVGFTRAANKKGLEMDIRQLQAHIKEFDHDPEQKHHYFLKLIEEVGELSESIRKNATGQPTEDTTQKT